MLNNCEQKSYAFEKQGKVVFESLNLSDCKKLMRADSFKQNSQGHGRYYYKCDRHVNCPCKRVRECSVNDELLNWYVIREYNEHSIEVFESADIKEFGLSVAKTAAHMTVAQTEILMLKEIVRVKGVSQERALECTPTAKTIDNLKQHVKRSSNGMVLDSSRALQVHKLTCIMIKILLT